MNFSSLFSPRVLEERNRLGLSQKKMGDLCGVSREMWGRYERGVAVMGTEVLFNFSIAGADVQFILTGVKSKNLDEITNKPNKPHFDFEGKLSTIVKVLEEVLNELNLHLPPTAKGKVIEILLMQALLKHALPTKDDIYPLLKLVA